MKVQHVRVANVNRGARQYCIAHVYVDGRYSHDAIEDLDRGLTTDMSSEEIARLKVQDKTAIPTGTYEVKMGITSQRFSNSKYYVDFCKAKLPRLDPVPGFSGILIHRGVNENSSSGCIIVGLNKSVGSVSYSQQVFERFYKQLKQAQLNNETITYEITRTYKV